MDNPAYLKGKLLRHGLKNEKHFMQQSYENHKCPVRKAEILRFFSFESQKSKKKSKKTEKNLEFAEKIMTNETNFMKNIGG